MHVAQALRCAVHSRAHRQKGFFSLDETEPLQFIKEGDVMRCVARALVQAAKTKGAILLRERSERPSGCRAAKKRDELASLHCLPQALEHVP